MQPKRRSSFSLFICAFLLVGLVAGLEHKEETFSFPTQDDVPVSFCTVPSLVPKENTPYALSLSFTFDSPLEYFSIKFPTKDEESSSTIFTSEDTTENTLTIQLHGLDDSDNIGWDSYIFENLEMINGLVMSQPPVSVAMVNVQAVTLVPSTGSCEIVNDYGVLEMSSISEESSLEVEVVVSSESSSSKVESNSDETSSSVAAILVAGVIAWILIFIILAALLGYAIVSCISRTTRNRECIVDEDDDDDDIEFDFRTPMNVPSNSHIYIPVKVTYNPTLIV